MVGIATKDYDDAKTVKIISDATRRATLIQIVRDPIECFVSQVRARQYRAVLIPQLGKKFEDFTPEAGIADAVSRYITPGAAAEAYLADSFERHVVVDVADLKGDRSAATVAQLWRQLCGDDNVDAPTFQPIGSREFVLVRTYSRAKADVAGRSRAFTARLDGDHWTGYFNALTGTYQGAEARVCTFPDASELMPSLGSRLPIHVFTDAEMWHSIHPSLRQPIARLVAKSLAERLKRLDPIHAAAKAAMTFTLADLTPVQRDLVRFGIEEDYAKFRKRQPAAAERWTQTREFLGV
ncbi:MAG: hypothetical protein FJX59_11645 [Alphaproteobacteria bacterium]|nr:hypothetical protein [Alphaproteobacteria bacterium]